MAFKLSAPAASAAIDASLDLVNLGAGTSELIVWGGSTPASLLDDVTVDNILLARFSLPNPAFGAASLIDSTVEALAFQIEPVYSILLQALRW
jgi:hypothetical protein